MGVRDPVEIIKLHLSGFGCCGVFFVITVVLVFPFFLIKGTYIKANLFLKRSKSQQSTQG